MKIIVLGGTGMAGSAVVDEALTRGHEVLALSRSPRPDQRAGVRAHALDISDVESLRPHLEDADAAVWAVRPEGGHEGASVAWLAGVLEAAEAADVPVVVVGGSAGLRSPQGRGLLALDDPSFVPPQWRAIARASLEQLEACRAHPRTRWTYISPSAAFEAGPASGRSVRGTDTLLVDDEGRSQTTSGDMARTVLDEIERPDGQRLLTVLSPS